MVILVSDTSILIDLERGNLLEAAFSCGLTMVVPDLLYDQELEDENGPYLKHLGLGVVNLTPKEVSLAQQIHTQRKALSLPDCFALSCATRPGHTLVTGDKVLRCEAKQRIGTVYGLLWILDAMATSGKTEIELLIEGLKTIASHPRCRLPSAETDARLAEWREGKSH